MNKYKKNFRRHHLGWQHVVKRSNTFSTFYKSNLKFIIEKIYIIKQIKKQINQNAYHY
jgi:hypothetical protein